MLGIDELIGECEGRLAVLHLSRYYDLILSLDLDISMSDTMNQISLRGEKEAFITQLAAGNMSKQTKIIV